MNPAFPEINLTPVNRTAALLLNTATPPAKEPVERFVGDLLGKAEELDRVLNSIHGQLATRSQHDREWRAAAKRALKTYSRQRRTIQEFLKAARATLTTVEQALALADRQARQVRGLAAAQALQEKAGAAKLERIATANSEDRRAHLLLKRLLREELGEERFLSLMDKFNKRMKGTNT